MLYGIESGAYKPVKQLLTFKRIFIVTPCMLSSYSINTPTNALIQKLHIKTLKLLRHVSVLRPSSGSSIFLAKVTLKIVTD